MLVVPNQITEGWNSYFLKRHSRVSSLDARNIACDGIALRIVCYLNSREDLTSFSLVNRDFYFAARWLPESFLLGDQHVHTPHRWPIIGLKYHTFGFSLEPIEELMPLFEGPTVSRDYDAWRQLRGHPTVLYNKYSEQRGYDDYWMSNQLWHRPRWWLNVGLPLFPFVMTAAMSLLATGLGMLINWTQNIPTKTDLLTNLFMGAS